MKPITMLDVHEAALRFYRRMRNDRQPLWVPVQWMEGRHIPYGTFDEWVHEVKGMGLCIMKYRQGKAVLICGQ